MHQEDPGWQTLETQIIYENPWIILREDQVIRPDGQPGIYSVLEMRPSVFIVPVTDRREIVLVHQYRYPSQKWGWETPGGGGGDEHPLVYAKKELQEETGLTARQWVKAGAYQAYIGVSNDICHFYFALGVEKEKIGWKEGGEEGDEQISTVQAFPFSRIWQMIKDEEIADVQSVAILLSFKLWWEDTGSKGSYLLD